MARQMMVCPRPFYGMLVRHIKNKILVDPVAWNNLKIIHNEKNLT